MRPLLIPTLLLLPLFLGIPPGVHAEHGPATLVVVNVQVGESHGCSTDSWTRPDLRARVWLNGHVVAETWKAQDTAPSHWLTLHEVPVERLPATLEIEVQEAEPAGLFGFGTSWVTCDTAAGSGTRARLVVDADGTTLRSRGDAANSASVLVHAAPADAPHPTVATLDVTDRSGSSVTVAWTPDAGVDGARAPTLAVYGHADVTPAAGASSATVTGLEENREYRMRLVRESPPWKVAGSWQRVKTANLPPAPPTVNAEAKDDGVHVTWTAQAHDIAAVEIHFSDAPGFQPSPDTLRHREDAWSPMEERMDGSQMFTGFPEGARLHVRAVAEDTEGARSTSPELTVTVRASVPPSTETEASAPSPNGTERTAGTPRAAPAPQRELDAPRVRLHERSATVTWRAPGADGMMVAYLAENGGAFDAFKRAPAAEGSVTFTHLRPGVSFEVKLRHARADGSEAMSGITRFVTPDGPPVVAALDVTPGRVLVGENVTIDFSRSNGLMDGPFPRFTLEADGPFGVTEFLPGREHVLTHVFETPGVHVVKLVVASDGARDSDVKIVRVIDPEAALAVPGAGAALLGLVLSATAALCARRAS